MRHPTLFAAVTAALLPAPALAEPEDGELSSAARAFADPERQEELAGTMQQREAAARPASRAWRP